MQGLVRMGPPAPSVTLTWWTPWAMGTTAQCLRWVGHLGCVHHAITALRMRIQACVHGCLNVCVYVCMHACHGVYVPFVYWRAASVCTRFIDVVCGAPCTVCSTWVLSALYIGCCLYRSCIVPVLNVACWRGVYVSLTCAGEVHPPWVPMPRRHFRPQGL